MGVEIIAAGSILANIWLLYKWRAAQRDKHAINIEMRHITNMPSAMALADRIEHSLDQHHRRVGGSGMRMDEPKVRDEEEERE